MKRLWVASGLLVVLVVGVAALASTPWRQTDDDTPEWAAADQREFRSYVEASGRLEAAVALEIGPPSARDFWNYNLSWMIPEGRWVEQGTVIARFDATQLDDQLRDHRATLEKTLQEREKEERNLEVSLRQLALDLAKAEGELKVVELDVAVPAELVATVEMEQARLKQQLAERRVAFLREKIEFEKRLVQAKLDLLDVKREFSESKIAYYEEVKERFSVRAPVSGMVVYVPKRNGDRWEVGESVWMLAKILKVADVSTLQVEADLLEVDAARVRPGQPAEIRVDAIPGVLLSSQVAEIGEVVRPRSLQDPSKVFDGILPLADVDTEVLRPGMSVQVRIESERLPDAVTVPLSAVRDSADGPYVQVRSGENLERRPVTLGPRNDERVVVRSGVAVGEQVFVGTREEAEASS